MLLAALSVYYVVMFDSKALYGRRELISCMGHYFKALILFGWTTRTSSVA